MSKIIIKDSRALRELMKGKGPDLPPPRILMANLTIYRCLNPDSEMDNWEVCNAADIPDWVKNPDVMAELVDGLMVNDEKKDLYWYRAEETHKGAILH